MKMNSLSQKSSKIIKAEFRRSFTLLPSIGDLEGWRHINKVRKHSSYPRLKLEYDHLEEAL